MSNSPPNDEFHVSFQRLPPLRNISREAAWARVIGARFGQVKRKNRPKSAFFQGPVNSLLAAGSLTKGVYM
jgi:hypothetical protein